MRVLWINVALGFGCMVFAQVRAGGLDNIYYEEAFPKNFKKDLHKLLVTHLELSVKYLYTGVGYGSQRVQRPGMANYLKEMSNAHWQEGIGTLKKYFKRGGVAEDLYSTNSFNFKGENELDMSLEMTRDMRIPYLNTLEHLYSDSKECTTLMNKLHKMALKDKDFHDADWSHYFEEKLEKEEERKRELKGHITTLGKMSKSSLALHIFDSNL